jgi:hypothetical protein
MKISVIQNVSDTEFTEIVKKSQCLSDVCKFLGLRRQGGYYRTIKKRIQKQSIDTAHFLPLSELMSSKHRNFNWISKEEFIQNINSFHETTLKKK